MRPTTTTRGKGKRRRRILLGIGSLLALALVAPTIVGVVGLQNYLLKSLLAPEVGVITARGASLGWFSHTRLNGVEVKGPSGERLLEIPELVVDRTVLSLLTNSTDLGSVVANRPTLYVEARESSSNLEEFISRLLTRQREPSQPVDCIVETVNGSVSIFDAETGGTTIIGVKRLSMQITQSDVHDLNATLLCESNDDGSRPDSSDEGRQLTVGLSSRAEGDRQLDVGFQSWPVHSVSPWLRRLLADAQVGGLLTAESTTTWSRRNSALVVASAGSATLHDISAQASIADDVIKLAEVQIPWKVRFSQGLVKLEEFSARSSVGSIAIRGEVPLDAIGLSSGEPWGVRSLRVPLDATGQLDLARLAATLPKTLRLREGVTVSSGRAAFSLSSRSMESGHRWMGSLTVSDLSASDRARSFRWERPISVNASFLHDNQWHVESLTCQSDYLQLAASGNAHKMTAQVDFDLAHMAAEVGQLVELDDWQLGGRGSLRAAWEPAERGLLRATMEGAVNGLRFAGPQGKLWQEPSVQLTASATLSLPTEGRSLSVGRGAEMTLTSSQDQAIVRLDGPAVWPLPEDTAQALLGDVQIQGNLGSWMERLSPWVVFDDWRVDGTARLTSRLAISGSRYEAKSLQIGLSNLRVIGPGWRIEEPRVIVETSGHLLPSQREITLGETTLAASSLSFRTRDTILSWSEESNVSQMGGELAFLAALDRMDAWRIGTDGRPLAMRPGGMLKGTIRVARQAEEFHVDLSGTASDLIFYEYLGASDGRQPGYSPWWKEPNLQFSASVGIRPAAGKLIIRRAAVQSSAVACALEGTLDDVTRRCEANVRGTVEYDLADASPLVAAFLGLDVEMSGREQATFELVGPLRVANVQTLQPVSSGTGAASRVTDQHWSRQLRGHVAAGWESMHFFGLPVGRGRLDAQLSEGVVTLAPVNVGIGSQGRLTASPRARLNPPPQAIFIPAGPLISDVENTPEVSDRMLKYFIPTLADAIETQGQFSLSTTGAQMPLTDPWKFTAAGELRVQRAVVRPGRVGRDWILLAEQIEAVLKNRQLPQFLSRPQQSLLTMDAQTVRFQIEEGRVYHDNLVFHIGEVEVRSRGSVGFDETLAIEIEVPVRNEWVAGRPWLGGFRGRSISGTIRGTFDNLDRSALLNDLVRQFTQGAAESAIEEGLNRALDRLLRPRE